LNSASGSSARLDLDFLSGDLVDVVDKLLEQRRIVGLLQARLAT